MNGPSKWRNPDSRWRVLFGALAYAIPGVLAGELASLFVGRPTVCMIVGAILGAASGAFVEWLPTSES